MKVPPQIKASWLTTSFWYESGSGINWMAWGIMLDLIFTTILPLLDVLSDLLYIIATGFYDWSILLICSLLYLHPLVFLFKDMWSKRYLPCFHLWHIPDRIWNLYDKVDNLVKLAIMAVLCMPFFLVNLLWMLPMICALFFLHSTRLLCVVELHSLWFFLWTGDSDTRAVDPFLIVDVGKFNNMSVRETLLESAPELILQIVNMIYMKQLNFVGLFSVFVSGLSIFNAVYKYFYYCCVLKYEVHAVPNVLQHIAEMVRGPQGQVANQYRTTDMEEEVDMVVFKQNDMQPIDEDNSIALVVEKSSAVSIYKDVAELKEFQKQSQDRFSAFEAKMEELIALMSDIQK
jgi:hypothetical protein